LQVSGQQQEGSAVPHRRKTEIPLPPNQRLRLLAYIAGLLLVLVPFKAKADAASAAETREEVAARIQRVLDGLREKLAIPSSVEVNVVEQNTLAFSVEPPRVEGGAFVLSIEASYLDLLTEEELEAALAHELGHVWIFTHHPYLQTESLANRIAMRTISRESLANVYEKVWKRLGAKGDLAVFLGPLQF
jgi:Peptidase family M48